eukprot:m.159333 g.159333  ORF g.159333 m.159333 type:complete len:66 (+) comp13368_c0_seq3:5719-5916(+)
MCNNNVCVCVCVYVCVCACLRSSYYLYKKPLSLFKEVTMCVCVMFDVCFLSLNFTRLFCLKAKCQ